MKSKLFLFALLAFVSTATLGQVKQDRTVSSFSAIDISGIFKVFVRTGDKCALTVIAENDALEDINMNPGILLEATDYHAAWGYESDDDDDLVLFGVGGPA